MKTTGAVAADDKKKKRDPWLKQWLYPCGSSAKELVASVVMVVRQHEERVIAESQKAAKTAIEKPRGTKRSRKKADQETLDRAVELVVCNLAHVALTPEGTGKIAYSRRKCQKPSRYDNPLARAELFLTAVDTLGQLGVLESVVGSYRHAAPTISPTEGFRTELAAHGVTKGDLGLLATEETIILKSRITGFGADGVAIMRGSGRRLPYEDTPATNTMREELRGINDFIGSADIDFLHDGAEPKVDTSERKLRRYFALVESEEPRFDLGGRMFGGWWQNLKRDRREHIRIEGEVCCLLDYSSMFPHLAYAHEGLQAPSEELYDLRREWPAFDLTKHRKAIKEAFCSLFFGRQRLDTELKKALPAKATMNVVREAVAKKHPPIASLLGGTVGYRLMMDESCIMTRVLIDLRDRGIVSLPIHDGLIVKLSDEVETQDVMLATALRCSGFNIPVLSTLLEVSTLDKAA